MVAPVRKKKDQSHWPAIQSALPPWVVRAYRWS